MSEDKNLELLNSIEKLSQYEIDEIELLMAIYQKRIIEITEKYIKELNDEFDYSYKNPEEKTEIRNEIINGYKAQFERIQNGLEEQYVNLFYELKEIQLNQKIALVNYKKTLSKDYILDKDVETLVNLINKYGNYCGVEDECYKMIYECGNSFEELLSSVMQYDKKELITEKKIGIFEKIKNLLKSKKKEDNFLISKREKIKNIEKNTDTVIQYIKNTTIKYISTLSIYRDIVKNEAGKTA